jgi:uncharacterized membrane protein YebE (DUF533 family)
MRNVSIRLYHSKSIDYGELMPNSFVQIILLAAVADGKIDAEEQALLMSYKTRYPQIKDISSQEFDDAKINLFNKLSAGFGLPQLIEELGAGLSDDQKNAAFALALEMCSANFEIVPKEKDFLDMIASKWKLKKSIVASLKLSTELRYGTNF